MSYCVLTMSDYFNSISSSRLSRYQRRSTWLVAIAVVAVWGYYDYKREINKTAYLRDNNWNTDDTDSWNKQILEREKNAKLLKQENIRKQKEERQLMKLQQQQQQQAQASNDTS